VLGCDTGFGNSLARSLAGRGYRVFAFCLTEKGMEDLSKWSLLRKKQECSNTSSRATNELIPLRVDVRDMKSVENSAQIVSDLVADEGLYCLVNNAGVQLGSLLDLTDISAYELTMDINFLGVVRMCKAFLPVLKRAKNARILNISSAAGFISSHSLTHYAASKHAVSAFTTALRQELECFSIQVSTINPGFFNTPMVTQAAMRMRELFTHLPNSVKSEYGSARLESFVQDAVFASKLGGDPEEVVATIAEIVTWKSPPAVNLVGRDCKLLYWPLSFAGSDVWDAVVNLREADRPPMGK